MHVYCATAAAHGGASVGTARADGLDAPAVLVVIALEAEAELQQALGAAFAEGLLAAEFVLPAGELLGLRNEISIKKNLLET